MSWEQSDKQEQQCFELIKEKKKGFSVKIPGG